MTDGPLSKLFGAALSGAIILASAGQASAASSERTDQLLWQCLGQAPTGMGELGRLACAKYIDGMMDMHSLAVAVGGSKPLFCPPKRGISLDQAVRVFTKWASENPNDLHKTARGSVVLALKSAFPCR